SPLFATRAAEIGVLLKKYRLPAAGWTSAVVNAGFLFSYSDDPTKVSRRAAEIAARILKGAKPSEVPVEQADEYEFAINASVAKSLGVRVPESVLARATRIIQ